MESRFETIKNNIYLDSIDEFEKFCKEYVTSMYPCPLAFICKSEHVILSYGETYKCRILVVDTMSIVNNYVFFYDIDDMNIDYTYSLNFIK